MSGSAFEIAELSEPEDLDAIFDEWSRLAEIDPGATPFQSPEWLIPWWKHVADGTLVAWAARRDGQLVGLLPMYIYPEPESGVRKLLLLGAGTSDYLGGIFDPAFQESVTPILFRALGDSSERWDVAEVFQLSPASPLLAYARRNGIHIQNSDPCSGLPVPMRAVLPAKIRANMRNYRNRAERQGRLGLTLATGETAPSFFHDLEAFHRKRWQHRGEPGVLAPERVQHQHVASIPLLQNRGLLRLYGLQLETQTIGVLYALADYPQKRPRSCYFYLLGWDQEYADLSPGTLLFDLASESCAAEGITRIDLLRGDENYKRYWGAQELATFRFNLYPTGQ